MFYKLFCVHYDGSKSILTEVDEKNKNIIFTEDGIDKAQELLGVDDLFDIQMQYAHHLLQALKAKELFIKDTDYVVRDNEVMIVDEFTGRLMQGRRWSDGLHQAIEAKEGVKVASESKTFATITFQNFFRLHEGARVHLPRVRVMAVCTPHRTTLHKDHVAHAGAVDCSKGL